MSLASVGNGIAFSCTVVSMITGRKSAGLAAPVRVATDRLSWRKAMSRSSPILWRQRVIEERSKGSLWQKNSSPQKSCMYGVSTQRSRRTSSERSCRCLRMAKPAMSRRTGQLCQGMGQVNDLIEPRPEQIRLACLSPLLGSHESSRRDPDGSMESRLPGRSNLPEKPSVPSRNRQTRILARTENLRLIRDLVILHGGRLRRGSAHVRHRLAAEKAAASELER